MSRRKVKFTKRLSVRLTAIGAVLALGAIAIASSFPSSGEPDAEQEQQSGGLPETSSADTLAPIPDADSSDQAVAAAADSLEAPPVDGVPEPADERFANPVFAMPSPDETVIRGNDQGDVIQASAETPVTDSEPAPNRNSSFHMSDSDQPRFTLPSFPAADDAERAESPEPATYSERSASPIGAPPAPLTNAVSVPEPSADPSEASSSDSLRQASQSAISDLTADASGEDNAGESRIAQPPGSFPMPDQGPDAPRFDAPPQMTNSIEPQSPSVYGGGGYQEGADEGPAGSFQREPGLEADRSGFAATTSSLSTPESAAPSTTGAESFAGNGVPGAENMEGIQAPALTIEKTAPPEIQVGKETEFQIVVRNTGPVAATDVVVVDAVPQGTRFVSTMPEATSTAEGQLMWQLGTLQPGDERVLKIQLLPMAEGEIGSVAEVVFQSRASARTICTKPELAVKHTGPQKVLIGDTVTLDITVNNPGTGAATNVILEEDVPEGLVHAAGRELERDLGTLRPGETRQVQLVLTAESPGMVRNVVLVRGDANLLVQDAIDLEVIAPSLEVSIAGPRLRYLERPATYEIGVANPGTAPAKEVELVTYLPKGMKFVSADNRGDYEPQNHAVYWSLEELPAKQSGVAKLTLLPLETGEKMTLNLEARAELGLQHSAEKEVQVDSLPQVEFTVADQADPIEVGADTTYVITLSNSGTSAATNIQLTVGVPPELKPIGGDGPTRVLVEGGGLTIGTLGRLGAGEQAVYKIRVQGLADGPQRFQVQLLSSETPVPVTKEEITRVYSDK